MIEELKEIEKDLDNLKSRVKRLIDFLEKRRTRLSLLTDEDLIGEAADRTLPATDIAELLGEIDGKKKRDK
jgi:hypothetical protein